MHTEEEFQKLKRAVSKLQADLDREIEYTRKVNDKNAQLMEQIRELKSRLEKKQSEDKPRIHNERGAGRKRIVSAEIAAMVLELSTQGLSQAKIAVKLSDEMNIKIGRTTVGEIVRGNYTPSNAK